MKTRRLGSSALEVSAIGLGCMGMSEFYGPSDQTASVETLHHAIDIGITFWDTAEIYGVGRNEELVGRALKGKRDQVVLATRNYDGGRRGEGCSPERRRKSWD